MIIDITLKQKGNVQASMSSLYPKYIKSVAFVVGLIHWCPSNNWCLKHHKYSFGEHFQAGKQWPPIRHDHRLSGSPGPLQIVTFATQYFVQQSLSFGKKNDQQNSHRRPAILHLIWSILMPTVVIGHEVTFINQTGTCADVWPFSEDIQDGVWSHCWWSGSVYFVLHSEGFHIAKEEHVIYAADATNLVFFHFLWRKWDWLWKILPNLHKTRWAYKWVLLHCVVCR